MGERQRFRGRIAGVGSTSGTRVVIGWWHESPFGAFADAMVERADGHRVLLAPSEAVAELVSTTYVFDEVRVEPVAVAVALQPERATPQRSAPQRATPESATPKRSAPQRATPERATPERATPERATPKRATPKRATPKRPAPERPAPGWPEGPEGSAVRERRRTAAATGDADPSGSGWSVTSPSLRLELAVGGRTALGRLLRLVPPGLAGTPAFATVTDPVARVVLRGVRTRGVARAGRREYYGATDVHAVTAIDGSFDGVVLGGLRPVDPPCRFGFSSTPRRPSLTEVVTTITDT